MKFPYRKINLKHPFSSKEFILRPIIPVSLKYRDQSLRYEALIEIAEKLGVRLKDANKITFEGIGGNMVEGVKADIVLGLGSQAASTKLVFAPVGNGVLGQYGFFDLFVVNFDLKKKEIEITTRERL